MHRPGLLCFDHQPFFRLELVPHREHHLSKLQSFTKIHILGFPVFRMDRQTDRQTDCHESRFLQLRF